MRRMVWRPAARLATAAAALLLAGAGTAAASSNSAQAAFCSGNWQLAAERAAADPAAEARLLASVAWRLHGRYGGVGRSERGAAYDRAVREAERGLEREPGSAALRLALAAALGRRCSHRRIRCYFDRSDADRGVELLEEVLRIEEETRPEWQAAAASLGAFLVRVSVVGMASAADRERGAMLMNAAEAAGNASPAARFEMARAWQDAGKPDQAARLLREIVEAEAVCAWEQELQSRARARLADMGEVTGVNAQ